MWTVRSRRQALFNPAEISDGLNFESLTVLNVAASNTHIGYTDLQLK